MATRPSANVGASAATPAATAASSTAVFGSGLLLGVLVRRVARRSWGRRRKALHRLAAAAQKGQDAKVGAGGNDIYKNTVLLPKTDFSQRANGKTREVEIQKFWNSQGVYQKLQDGPNPKGSFTLHDGPPYANGSLHMGHALNKILKDAINKFKAVRGYKVKYIPGWDCHGLPIELKVLQGIKNTKERQGLTPLQLRKRAAEFALEAVKEQRTSFERYGVWGDFDKPYLTLLPKYEAAQLGIFEEMVRGGHIYRGRKPVYWSPSTRTALAESELEYPEGHVSPSIYAAFRCVGELPATLPQTEGLEVAVWTTTPWTIPANRAVAVNPMLQYAIVRADWAAEEGRPSRRLIVGVGLEDSLAKVIGATLTVEAQFDGGALEGLKYEHPITSVLTPVVMGGDYITTESGTGLVHTAPGHGADDFLMGQKYGLEVAAPVDNAGNFTEEVGLESLVGANVLEDANQRVTEVLKERGLLLAMKPYPHKYPYDWRSKKPVITRATPQWFASIDGLRARAMEAVSQVQFIPANYANRMRPMIEGRSDWCISRQRSWGVPIPAFFHKDTGEALLTPESIRHVRDIVAEKGTDAWWELSVAELLPEEYRGDADLYEKGTDTMDVWFDSGSSWAAVRDELGSPIDLYLEGSDQHRGWFQSSLITSVAVQGVAPYKAVMTHGFCVDGDGRKMSKSIGNVIDPRTIIEGGADQKKQPALGADVLRFWAASVDFTSDVAISPTILSSMGETYKKIRNRARFILGNIHDFNPTTDAVAYAELPLLDRYIIKKAESVFTIMTEAYEEYSFSRATSALVAFLQIDLSSLYLDLAKDRLYTAGQSSHLRRSCQTVLRWMLVNSARVMAPVLSHLAEDIWQFLPGEKEEASIFLSGWWAPFPGSEEADASTDAIPKVFGLRSAVNLALEKARRSSMIGSSLEARVQVVIKPQSELSSALQTVANSRHQDADGLKWLLGVSQAEIVEGDLADPPEDTAQAVSSSSKDPEVMVTVTRASGTKCERCWVYCQTVGASTAHPSICNRCDGVMKDLGAPSLQAV